MDCIAFMGWLWSLEQTNNFYSYLYIPTFTTISLENPFQCDFSFFSYRFVWHFVSFSTTFAYHIYYICRFYLTINGFFVKKFFSFSFDFSSTFFCSLFTWYTFLCLCIKKLTFCCSLFLFCVLFYCELYYKCIKYTHDTHTKNTYEMKWRERGERERVTCTHPISFLMELWCCTRALDVFRN